MKRWRTIGERVAAYAWIAAGSTVTALAINVFLVPYRIAPGGVSGIAAVIYYLSGKRLPVGAAILALNIPLFLIGVRFIGKRTILRTLVSTVLLSMAIDLTKAYTGNFVRQYLSNPAQVGTGPDVLLYSLFGGFIMGLGMGIVFKGGATTGGSDLAARIVHHFLPHISIGKIILFIDTGTVVLAAVAFRSFQLALYAIVTLFVSSRVIDAILEGVNFAKAVFIISERSDEIAARVMAEMDRGVTGLYGKGMYTGKDKRVLLCVLQRAQIPLLKNMVKEIDKDAFVVLTDVREVLGEGFNPYGHD